MKKLIGPSLAEFFGTLVLVCVVVGSGIMGTNISSDAGIALLINTISIIFALALLILILGPVSGAQFNPVVSLALLLQKEAFAVNFLGLRSSANFWSNQRRDAG